MRRLNANILAVFVLMFFAISSFVMASDKKGTKVTEANVWTTEDGVKHFTCPVMGNEGIVDSTTTYADVEGKRYYFCCSGCAGKLEKNPHKYLENFAVPGNIIKTDKDGKKYQCPVSGEVKKLTDKTESTDYQGKRYYFCCAGCKTKFQKEPEKYLKNKKQEGNSDKMKPSSKM